ncbi:MAG: radical SAM protein [Thermoplasmata archaeon]|nr:MAG: radical SAM protein [Thermoplasmata archaeon]
MTINDRPLDELLQEARELSWSKFGKRLVCYIPGMFSYFNERGKYPAISLTGKKCALDCDHCGGKLLEPMIEATKPEKLLEICKTLGENGNSGVLISGGCDATGKLPWDKYIEAIKMIKEETDLKVSIHAGLLDLATAKALKNAGVDQALFDVLWSEELLSKVYHLDVGFDKIKETMDAINNAGLDFIPHVVVGLMYGKIDGELKALEMIAKYKPKLVVIVALMDLENTKMVDVPPPTPEEIARIIAAARLMMPETEISLGCARPRKFQPEIDKLAIEAGVNRIAIPTEQGLARAKELGLEIQMEKTCCSLHF